MEGLQVYRSLFLVMCLQINYAAAVAETDEPFEIKFLKEYNYLSTLEKGNQNVEKALREFQEQSEIPVTGVFDVATIKEMKKPRCGVPDKDEKEFSESGRVKRHFSFSGHKWNKTYLTYKFFNFAKGSLTPNLQRAIVSRAFQAWEAISPLSFMDVTPDKRHYVKSDITIAFLAGKHRGCLHPFDGPGGVFAHAFYPDEGDLHFDADENWTDGVYHGTNLYSVTLHEIGHLLGLRHSNKATAIMHETYKAYDPNMKLTIAEKLGINFIYTPRCTDDPTYANICKKWKSRNLCNHVFVRPKCKNTCNVKQCATG
ncbi:Matrix metalloproteinase-19 [Acropora cervicornis]|uniref:Matrix metalloproteinase-19 n=1 Tax=Acropora cervicornis TaxID=6130 RepID=A0AAD9Q111_ACRCE|nr:Matrix metalloproteinase-19 [Acropora cervicornis]